MIPLPVEWFGLVKKRPWTDVAKSGTALAIATTTIQYHAMMQKNQLRYGTDGDRAASATSTVRAVMYEPSASTTLEHAYDP